VVNSLGRRGGDRHAGPPESAFRKEHAAGPGPGNAAPKTETLTLPA